MMMNKIFKAFNNYKFKTKLLVSYIVVGMLPIIIWSYFSYNQTNNFLVVQAKEGFHSLFNNIYQSMDNQFSKCVSDFQSVSHNVKIGQIINSDYPNNYDKYNDVTNQYDPLVDTVSSLNPAIENVIVYTDGGLKDSRVNFRRKDEMPDGMERKLASTLDILWEADDNYISIVQALPSGASFEKFGVLLFQLNKKIALSSTLFDSLKDMSLRVIDRNGATLALHNPQNIDIMTPSKNIYTIEKEFNQNGWKLVMYMDLSSVEIAPLKSIITTLLVIAISVVLMILIIFVFTNNLNKRIFVLDQQLSRVVKSNFRTHISSPYHDEIGDITNTIGKVIDEIKIMINEVYESKLIQREAEIKALQSQINPHFLYNTLSAINWEAIKIGNNDINKIVNALSAFYRSTLNKGNDITTVQNEVDNVKAYIEIQMFIHRNSFDVEFELTESVMEYNTPCIILQPIVENAIEHGVNLKKDGRGKISIKVFEKDNDIIFEVADNGHGMSKEMIDEVLVKAAKGYGVKNVNERLKLLFGYKYGLSIESVEQNGTKVTMKIPKYIH